MNPREIYYLLGKCLAMVDFPAYQEEIASLVGKKDFPWDRFVNTGSNHLVLPAIYHKFHSCGLQELFPPDLCNHLESIFRLNELRNEGILEQSVEMDTRFRSAGIIPVFIKGVASLASGIYTHPAERMLSDIDCVIPETQVRKAAELLRKEGYTHAPYRKEDLPFMHHFPTLSRPGSAVPVDLHFMPVAGDCGRYLGNWEDRTRQVEKQADGQFETVGLEDLALLNFLHSQVQDHGDYYARVSLKNLYEFYRIEKSGDIQLKYPFQRPSLDRKLRNYRAIVERTFYPVSSQSARYEPLTRIFLKRFDLNKSSRFYSLVSRAARQLLFQAAYYLKLFSRAILQKKFRRYVIVRMGDRAWPRSHFIHLRRKFSRTPNQ